MSCVETVNFINSYSFIMFIRYPGFRNPYFDQHNEDDITTWLFLLEVPKSISFQYEEIGTTFPANCHACLPWIYLKLWLDNKVHVTYCETIKWLQCFPSPWLNVCEKYQYHVTTVICTLRVLFPYNKMRKNIMKVAKWSSVIFITKFVHLQTVYSLDVNTDWMTRY